MHTLHYTVVSMVPHLIQTFTAESEQDVVLPSCCLLY